MSTPRKPVVAVVFGGRSSEHSISCISAGSVIAALDPDKYDVVPIGITTEGQWVLEAHPEKLALGAGGELPAVSGKALDLDGSGAPARLAEVDVVFPVMHGPWGQDGTLQGLLEMAGVRYVGAGVLSSAVGTDKHFMKLLFTAQGVPTVDSEVIRPGEWDRNRDAVVERVSRLGYPVFVKPTRAGSSFGITRVDVPSELGAAIEEAERFDPKVIVEAAAVGAREVEIGVLQDPAGGPPQTSALAEILVSDEHAFYDFEAKYLEESYRVPASLAPEVEKTVRELAVQAFLALDVEGLARVDFFVFPDGRAVVNEVETMPGFTATSMFPLMWKAAGLEYPDLVDRLVQLAMARSTGLR